MVDELDKDQSTVALEEGLDKEQNGVLEKSPAESGLKRLHIIAAVGLLASIVFAVVFPAVYVSKKLRIEPSPSNDNYAKSPVITRGPFNASMEFFSKDILNVYNSSDQLSYDIEQAAYFMLNQVVERNSQQDTSGQPGATFATADGESGNSAGIAAGKSAVGNDVNDYGTNNQENQVEEGDVIVSDGTHGMIIQEKCCHASTETQLTSLSSLAIKYLPLMATISSFGTPGTEQWLHKSRCQLSRNCRLKLTARGVP